MREHKTYHNPESLIDQAIQLDGEDKLVQELLVHGRHKNLSFFAFTATPKPKTLEMFGEEHNDGTFHPFHVYSMRQAIEEGFILEELLKDKTIEEETFKPISKFNRFKLDKYEYEE